MTGTAFITGATAGIGAAATRRFVDAGWRVIAVGRRAERLDQLVADLPAGAVLPITVDVTDDAAVDTALANLPVGWRTVDLLVNNAGLGLGTGAAQDARIADWDQMIRTNILALATLTRKLLPALIESRGAIINVSSAAASYPGPGGAVYGATKAFVSHFTLGLRADLAGTGVRVTALEPGVVETDFVLVRTGDQAEADRFYAETDPLTAGDMADTLLWIASQPARVNINRLEVVPISQSPAGSNIARG